MIHVSEEKHWYDPYECWLLLGPQNGGNTFNNDLLQNGQAPAHYVSRHIPSMKFKFNGHIWVTIMNVQSSLEDYVI
jgi:hypothetical protein